MSLAYNIAVFLLLWVTKRSGVWGKAPIIKLENLKIKIIKHLLIVFNKSYIVYTCKL